MKIKGNIVDIFKKEIYSADIIIDGSKIMDIRRANGGENYILPGLIDAHIHIESSMCTPGAFAAEAVSRGTTAVVSDPHEIANVLGIEGVKFMIEDSRKVPLKFFFGAPSCVPATNFETSGASIGPDETNQLLRMPEIKYLAEMMNFPGVIYGENQVLAKIELAKKHGKPADGHAPGLTGENLKKYVRAGISTDHECISIQEAREKLELGMKILIREGSAARNLDSLKDLLRTNSDMVMLCSDDLHPEMLLQRHIDKLIARLVREGFNLFDIIRSCTLNPAIHYGLEAGLLRPGDPADLVIVDNPREMNVIETWINGKKVYDRGKVLFNYSGTIPANNFNCSEISAESIKIKPSGKYMRIIEAFEGQLVTGEKIETISSNKKFVDADPSEDILKIVVKDRYKDSPPAVGFIKGFGLKEGAMASSVAHDSHNIICVGVNDNDIIPAINEIIRGKGGLALATNGRVDYLPLPVAGIMSDKPVREIAEIYQKLTLLAGEKGCRLQAPFMTLSFMALLVIPELKIGDKGLFDGRKFRFVPLMFD
ncbi:MAG TPA: adenine deaminase [Bacteroidales bacterium]|nr:adenine deaminase [Bacteroidales bacterium]